MTFNVSEYRLGYLTLLTEKEKLQTLYIFVISIINIQVNGLDLFQAHFWFPRSAYVFGREVMW